jgi:hypothetical protein
VCLAAVRFWEVAMSIESLRQHLGDVTMRYEDGGKVQVFMRDGLEAKVGPNATVDEIKAAFADAQEKLNG